MNKDMGAREWAMKQSLRGHIGGVRALAFHDTNPFLLSASEVGDWYHSLCSIVCEFGLLYGKREGEGAGDDGYLEYMCTSCNLQ